MKGVALGVLDLVETAFVLSLPAPSQARPAGFLLATGPHEGSAFSDYDGLPLKTAKHQKTNRQRTYAERGVDVIEYRRSKRVSVYPSGDPRERRPESPLNRAYKFRAFFGAT
jgi:hypothetical protein